MGERSVGDIRQMVVEFHTHPQIAERFDKMRLFGEDKDSLTRRRNRLAATVRNHVSHFAFQNAEPSPNASLCAVRSAKRCWQAILIKDRSDPVGGGIIHGATTLRMMAIAMLNAAIKIGTVKIWAKPAQ